MKRKTKEDLLQEIERLQRRIAEQEAKGGAPDITERKGAEEALASSEQFLNNVIEQGPVSLWISDSKGTLIKMNQACRELFGVTDEEAVGKYNLFSDNVIEEQGFMPLVKNVFEKGEIARFTIDYDLPRVEHIEVKEGTHRILDVVVSPINDIHGKLTNAVVQHMDITERRRAEKQLQAANQQLTASNQQLRAMEQQLRASNQQLEAGMERLAEAQAIARLGSWEYDAVKDVISGSDEFHRLFGVGHDRLRTYQAFIDLLHPDDREHVGRDVQESLTKKALYDTEYLVRLPDGDYRHIHARGQVFADDAGKSVRMVGTCLDITERKRAEEELRESERKFHETVKYLDEGYYSCTIEGEVLEHNIAFNRILGFELAQNLKGEKLPDFWQNPDDRKEYLAELMSRGFVRNFLIDAKTIRGEKLIVMANSHLVKDKKGTPVRIEGTFTDFTERKRAEDESKIIKDRLLFATEGAKLGIWNWNTITGELIWSDKCKALFGIPLDETMSYPRFREALHPDDRERTDKAVQDALNNHTDYDIEYRSLWPDGSIHWLAAKGRGYYDATGKAARLEGAVLDIDARKRDEEALKQSAADLERSNKELEQFAYVASHDLQEPLRMISSYTQLLAQRYEGQLDDKAKKYIDYAVDGAVRMQRLINDLLMYSRVGTRGGPLEPTDVHSVLGEVIRNLAAAIDENRAIITNDDLPTVLVDASQLAQVFQNLIANAIKFRGESPPRIHVSAQDRGHEWVFSISDKGIGIDPQYKDRIFMIFQRLHTKLEYPGTGIGLALCKRIVERHGGRIWFESEPGKGTTFFFSIPK